MKFSILYPRSDARNPENADELLTRALRGDGTIIITKAVVEREYRKVASLEVENVDDVFTTMNGMGDDTAPYYAARKMAMSGRVDHTSMSVGDVARCDDDMSLWVCDPIGWRQITK